MRKDLPLALTILVGAFLLIGGCRSVDWKDVWTYDVAPWLHWDGKAAPEPVGEGWRLEQRHDQPRYELMPEIGQEQRQEGG